MFSRVIQAKDSMINEQCIARKEDIGKIDVYKYINPILNNSRHHYRTESGSLGITFYQASHIISASNGRTVVVMVMSSICDVMHHVAGIDLHRAFAGHHGDAVGPSTIQRFGVDATTWARRLMHSPYHII